VAKLPIYEEEPDHLNFKKGALSFHISINKIKDYYPLHRHDLAELSYVIDGTGNEIINGKQHRMKPGTMSFLLPHQIHEIFSDHENPIKLFSCMFNLDVIVGTSVDHELSNLLLRAGDNLSLYVELDQDRIYRMKAIMADLHREYHGTALCKSTFIHIKVIEALLVFVRAIGEVKKDPSSEEPTGTIKRKKNWDVILYVNNHYWDHLTLKEMAELFQLSVPYLSHTFKEYAGQSFLKYLHEIRIHRASSLLVSSDMPIVDISAEVGFESFRTFSRVFKEIKKITPSDYRNSSHRHRDKS
jgi:AraC-like DNA-binding protein